MKTHFAIVMSIILSLYMLPKCNGQDTPTPGNMTVSTGTANTTLNSSTTQNTPQKTSTLSPITTGGDTTTMDTTTTTSTIIKTTTNCPPYKGFDVGSFFGGFALCAALVIIIFVAWKFLCSSKKPDYNTI